MKNNFLFFAVTLSLIIWIFSCKKSEISIDQIDSQTPKIENRDPFTSIGGDVWNLIQDTTDVESNKINWAGLKSNATGRVKSQVESVRSTNLTFWACHRSVESYRP